jgi:hypothetical protein
MRGFLSSSIREAVPIALPLIQDAKASLLQQTIAHIDKRNSSK